MTYNIRGAADAPPRDWASRLPLMRRVLRDRRPDLLGVQEALSRQLRDLDRALPGYDWIGRRNGTRNEFGAVFYRKDRFEVLHFGFFSLSDTPEVVGSASWGNVIARMVTWIRFRDRRTGAVFYYVNTHFDHQSANSRVRSASLILERVRGFGAPVVLGGDFNVAAGRSGPYAVLTGRDALADTWATARRHGPDINTYNAWRSPVPGGDRIDWILTRGRIRTSRAQIDPYQKDGLYPSDHYPVLADLQIG